MSDFGITVVQQNSHRHGRRTPCRSAGAAISRQFLDQQLGVDDLRRATPAVFAQLDRQSRLTDKIYVHIDMDVLDPREPILVVA